MHSNVVVLLDEIWPTTEIFQNKILKLGDFEGFQSPDLYAWFSACIQNI
jgi:hypothetical protein